jgi:hypothetical protein
MQPLLQHPHCFHDHTQFDVLFCDSPFPVSTRLPANSEDAQ